jgi:hypothetical protein
MKLGLIIELEDGESGNLINLLKGEEGDEKIARILQLMARVKMNQGGPVSGFGIGSGERRLQLDFRTPVSEIE